MSGKSIHQKIDWTPEDRARHAAIRQEFAHHPSLEELIASGEYEGPYRLGDLLELRQAVHTLKKERETKGLTVAQMADLCGVESPALVRLEDGGSAGTSIGTLLRYAAALGKTLRIVIGDPAAGQERP